MSRRKRQISPSYNVTRIDTANGLTRYAVSRLDESGLAQLDTYRTPSAASHAVHLLASDAAEVRPHAVPGCRVTAANHRKPPLPAISPLTRAARAARPRRVSPWPHAHHAHHAHHASSPEPHVSPPMA